MSSEFLVSLLSCLRKEEIDTHRSSFLENGSILLEDLIASCNGKSNPIRNYSADELMRATNNFDPSGVMQQDSSYKMFQGFLDNRSVIIKKYYTVHWLAPEQTRSMAIRDIVISIQMSTHKNVLKLLGCCLEFPIPALVYEYAAKGVLNFEGGYGNNESLPWKTRLSIAKQLANAITYLHTAFPRPIILRDLKPNCFFLDNDYVPKICNFATSITIPPMQSHVYTDYLIYTPGYLDPTYSANHRISEKN
ncbi:serine/threonine-protein kinase ZRK1-like [Rosa sericea]